MEDRKRKMARWSIVFFLAVTVAVIGSVFLVRWRQARAEKAYIRSLVEARKEVYAWANCYEKTMQINGIDNLILEAVAYDFSDLKIEFVGDSITFGTGGEEKEDGNKISYVEYVSEAMSFAEVIKKGMPGRMIADNGCTVGSLHREAADVLSGDWDILVIFCGLNDYLAGAPTEAGKLWGRLDDGNDDGYCGQLQAFMQFLSDAYPKKDIFFVICYQIPVEIEADYADHDGSLTLNDYMEQQRVLAERYGYHIIELYDTGFMDMRDWETAEELSWDKLHPNDNGYRVLGEHIAAELALYYTGVIK